MKKQARDIAKTSNGKVVLVAADELKVTSSFYGSIMEVFLQKKRKLMVKLSIQRFQFHY